MPPPGATTATMQMLPHDLVSQVLACLSPEDTLRLRAVSRELRFLVDLLARWPELAVQSAGRGLRDFVLRAAHCRPSSVHVLGGVCWNFAAPALAAMGEGIRSLHLERAPVGQAQLAMVLRAAPNLDSLRVDNLSGGAVVVPALPPGMRRVRLSSSHGPDGWAGDLCLSLGGLRRAPGLEELKLVMDRPYSQVVPGFHDLESRHTLKKLTLVHWGTVRLADLAEYALLETLVLRAVQIAVRGAPLLPSVLRCCVPYRYAEEFIRCCPSLYELYVYFGSNDRDAPVMFDLEDIRDVPCLTLHMLPGASLKFACDTLLEFDAWMDRVTLRVLCATDVPCSIMSADQPCVSSVITHTSKDVLNRGGGGGINWSDINWYFDSETLV